MKAWPSITAALIFLLATAAAVCAARPGTVIPDGVWARGQTVIVFARLESCPDRPYQPRQPFVSHDGGKTWTPSGPLLDGREFLNILDTGPDLWIAGQGYAEGPTHDPFLLLFGPDNTDWPEFEIYSGGAELLAVAHEARTGKFLAWVHHLDLNTEGWNGPVYLHQSMDGGHTWKPVRKVHRVPKSVPGLRFFAEIPRRSGPWRISGVDAAPVVEHRQADGKWQRIPDLPAQPCTEAD